MHYSAPRSSPRCRRNSPVSSRYCFSSLLILLKFNMILWLSCLIYLLFPFQVSRLFAWFTLLSAISHYSRYYWAFWCFFWYYWAWLLFSMILADTYYLLYYDIFDCKFQMPRYQWSASRLYHIISLLIRFILKFTTTTIIIIVPAGMEWYRQLMMHFRATDNTKPLHR